MAISRAARVLLLRAAPMHSSARDVTTEVGHIFRARGLDFIDISLEGICNLRLVTLHSRGMTWLPVVSTVRSNILSLVNQMLLVICSVRIRILGLPLYLGGSKSF